MEYVDIRPMYLSEMFLSSSSVQFNISPATNSLYEMSKVWLWLYTKSLRATLSCGLKFIVSGKILVKETEDPLLGLAKPISTESSFCL